MAMKNNIVISTIVGGFCLSNINAGACCKPVPEGLKKLEIFFNNLNGFTYKNIKKKKKKENGKKNIKGKDIVSNGFAGGGAGLDIVINVYLDTNDKDESAKYTVTDAPDKGKKYIPVKITLKNSKGETTIKNDDTEYDVDNVNCENEVDNA